MTTIIRPTREGAMTFSAFYTAYVRAIRLGNTKAKADRTAEGYELTYSQFVTHLRDQGLKDDVKHFNPDQVEAFRDRFLEGGMKKNSVRNKMAGLASLGKWGVQNKVRMGGPYYLKENPVDRVQRPEKQAVREKYLTRQELQALLALEMAPNERLALDLFLDTACRVSELARPKVKDLRLEGDSTILTVRLKGGREKDVVLGEEVARSLEAALRQREAGPEESILVNQAGQPYNRSSLSTVIARLAIRAGIHRIPVRPHVLRKTVANIADETGAELSAIAGILNHADMGTVQKYVFAKNRRVEEAKARVREVLRG